MNWTRFRFWLARRLLRGTVWCVALQQRMTNAMEGVAELDEYVQKSGALRKPSRIHAKRRIERLLPVIRGNITAAHVADWRDT